MALERSEGCWWVSCDTCSDAHDLDAENFQEAVDEVKEAGWTITKVDGEWTHICGACQEDAVG